MCVIVKLMVISVIFWIAIVVNFAIALFMLRKVYWATRHFLPTKAEMPIDSALLPSVTVCIPARNEQHVLNDTLEMLLRSSYPKLEIIVLDDTSADNTSTIIKAFAKDGVRFVPGKPLPKNWLGKNHALSELLAQASGKYVLFIGVDVRLEPQAVHNIATYAENQKAAMVSVLPNRSDPLRLSVLFSPLRYFWELILHNRLRPATASGVWLINRHILQTRFQGFEPYKTAIQPEAKIAAELASTSEYRFIISTKDFGVNFAKKLRSSWHTSTRLLYPTLQYNWAITALAIGDMILLLAPFSVLISLFWLPFSFIHLASATVALLFMFAYGIYTKNVWRHGWYFGAILWPVLVLQETILIVVSYVKYRTKSVTWKGRPVQQEVQS